MFDLSYKDLLDISIEKPEEFWDSVGQEVVWSKPYRAVLENKFSHSPKWFVGGEINMSYNCLDKHVEDGYGGDVAVIHDSPITGSLRLITYNELLQSVSRLAGLMVDRCGLKKGDIVLLHMPVVPECLIAMLACTRIGVVYAVTFSQFAPKLLAKRIEFIEPKLIVTCNAGPEKPNEVSYFKEKMDLALNFSKFQPQHCLVYNRRHFNIASMIEGRDLDWDSELMRAKPHGPVPMNSNHPMYIIFTSGTTGDPKGFVQSTGTAVVYNKYMIKYLYGIKPKETIWSLSDFSWVIGQCLSSYSPLLIRSRTVLFEGSLINAPDNSQFARVLNWHKVRLVLALPRAVRLLRRNCSQSDLELNYDGLTSFNLGGEESDENLRDWISKTFNCKVVNCYGLTELGGGVTRSIFRDMEAVDNSGVLRTPSVDFRVVDRYTGIEIPRGNLGRVVIKLPTLPGMMATLYKNDERFVEAYFKKYPGYFDTKDIGIMADDGTIQMKGRDGDIINTGFARINDYTVVDACLKNECIDEAVIVEYEDDLRGPIPFTFLILKNKGEKPDEEIIEDTIKLVNEIIGEVACFQRCVIVDDLPTTASGKVHKPSLRAMVNCEVFEIPSAVVNGYVYPVIHAIITNAGYNATLPID